MMVLIYLKFFRGYKFFHFDSLLIIIGSRGINKIGLRALQELIIFIHFIISK